MNPILITRIADQKTFSEESLAELLAEDFPEAHNECVSLRYEETQWQIIDTFGLDTPVVEDDYYILDPTEYKISFANTLDIEGVREMIEEMKDSVSGMPVGYEERKATVESIDSIASKYVNQK